MKHFLAIDGAEHRRHFSLKELARTKRDGLVG